MEEKKIGVITHYFGQISVGIIKLDAPLKVGDTIHIKGATSDFTQKVDSMQVEHKNIEEAKKGDSIGLKVAEHARENDTVYQV